MTKRTIHQLGNSPSQAEPSLMPCPTDGAGEVNPVSQGKWRQAFRALLQAFALTLCTLPAFAANEVQFVCDFVGNTPDFYELKNGLPSKIEDPGIVSLEPLYFRFAGIKYQRFQNEYFMFGYFISIHPTTQNLAPTPMGYSYVKRDKLVCLNLKEILPASNWKTK